MFTIKGLNFIIRETSTDKEIVNEVVESETYFRGKLTVKSGDIVIDIGAHIGSFSLLAASLGGKVYSYEPCKENFELLTKNIKLNNFSVDAHNVGVMGSSGKRTLYIESFNFGGTNFYNNSQLFSVSHTEEIDCITLEDIYKDEHLDHCDFLKLDCQGAEAEIIRYFPYLDTINKIGLEYDGLDNLKELKEILSGFKIVDHVGKESGVLLLEKI